MPRVNPKNLLCLLLAAVLVVLALATSQVSANQATYDFLMQFRNAYDGVEDLWPNPSSTDDYCTYEGIYCDANGYVEIDLSNRGLVGHLPDVGSDYQYANNGIMVVSIYLQSSRIDGTLPDSWQYLTNLKHLSVGSTQVDGTLPDQWGSMNLEILYISNTRLCGSLPTWSMPNLQVVGLSYNRMGGTLSESWSSMTTLTSVDISGNGNAFCGCVPDSWKNVTALSKAASNANAALTASNCSSDNRCDGSERCVDTGPARSDLTISYGHTFYFLMQLRNQFDALKSLWPKPSSIYEYCSYTGITCYDIYFVRIDLSNRGLEGNLPELSVASQFANNGVMVTSIDLSGNSKVGGDLPDSWRYLTHLKYLDLGSTQVGGTLPDKWKHMSLEELDISNARVCGSLPTWSMRNLQVVDLSKNRMFGTLSESWTSMTKLTRVDISGNAFCGCVPDSWKNVAALNKAANNANAGLTALNCSTTNTCNHSTRCSSAASGVASLVASVAAIAAVAAAMVL